jgi:SPOR domain
MADDNFRSYRSHDPSAAHGRRRDGGLDPLAELARLIGQGDPYGENASHGAYDSGRAGEATAAASDWPAEESFAARDERVGHYDTVPASTTYAPPEPDYYETEEPPDGRYFSGPAATFNGFREDPEPYEPEAPRLPVAARPVPAYATAQSHESYGAEYDRGEGYAADDDYDERPNRRRRSGLVIAMAIFSLAVVGTAGAFGYRAVFGGSVLPTLPPIIKASDGPNKIVPDSQASNANRAGAAATGSAENLVSREEQPVNMEPPKAPPHVVSTIPIGAGQGSPSEGAVAAASDSVWPPPPSPGGASPPAVAPAPMPAGVSPPAQASAEPKKVHTVTIRANQPGSTDAAPAPPVPPARVHATPPAPRSGATASTPPARSSAPLSIMPGGAAEAPPPAAAVSTRVAVAAPPAPSAPLPVASAAPVAAGVPAASPSSGGGYTVQVTSQRSEGEAKAAFRELRAKYPTQLSGREAMIRRADLGAKGTYYRALVGPFASAEEAAGLCSGLKAAGGSCLVQRN